jgi:hypothetical protein
MTARTCSPAQACEQYFGHRGEEGQAHLRRRTGCVVFKVDEEKALAAAIAQVKLEAVPLSLRKTSRRP